MEWMHIMFCSGHVTKSKDLIGWLVFFALWWKRIHKSSLLIKMDLITCKCLCSSKTHLFIPNLFWCEQALNLNHSLNQKGLLLSCSAQSILIILANISSNILEELLMEWEFEKSIILKHKFSILPLQMMWEPNLSTYI